MAADGGDPPAEAVRVTAEPGEVTARLGPGLRGDVLGLVADRPAPRGTAAAQDGRFGRRDGTRHCRLRTCAGRHRPESPAHRSPAHVHETAELGADLRQPRRGLAEHRGRSGSVSVDDDVCRGRAERSGRGSGAGRRGSGAGRGAPGSSGTPSRAAIRATRTSSGTSRYTTRSHASGELGTLGEHAVDHAASRSREPCGRRLGRVDEGVGGEVVPCAPVRRSDAAPPRVEQLTAYRRVVEAALPDRLAGAAARMSVRSRVVEVVEQARAHGGDQETGQLVGEHRLPGGVAAVDRDQHRPVEARDEGRGTLEDLPTLRGYDASSPPRPPRHWSSSQIRALPTQPAVSWTSRPRVSWVSRNASP